MKAILVTLGVRRSAFAEWGAHGYVPVPSIYQPNKAALTAKDKQGHTLPYVMVEVRDDLRASDDNYKVYNIITDSIDFVSLRYNFKVGKLSANNQNDIEVEYEPPRHAPSMKFKSANAGNVLIDGENVPVFVIYPSVVELERMDYINMVIDHRGVRHRPNGVMTDKNIAAIPCIDEPRHHIDITTKILSFIKTIPVSNEVHTLDKFID
jgi:hypothetical protein